MLWYYDTLHVTGILYFFLSFSLLHGRVEEARKRIKNKKKKNFMKRKYTKKANKCDIETIYRKTRLKVHAIYRGMVNWLCHRKGKGEGEISSFESEETVLPLKMASDDNVPCRVYAKKCSKTLIGPWILAKSNCTVIIEIFYTIVR